jgi:hypothetical protein
MKKNILFLLMAVMFGCSAVSNIPSDFKASYISKSELTKWSMSIQVDSDEMKLSYLNNGVVGNGTYSLTNEETGKLYDYMKSSGFLSMSQPQGEKITDMPTQKLSGTYNSKSNSIEFGTVKEPPVALTTLKQMLIDLAGKHNKDFKKVMGYE